METKEELVNNIKEWIKIDNEISKFQNEIKDRKNKKKNLTDNLMNVMKKNEIDCFDINGGSLIYKKNKVIKRVTLLVWTSLPQLMAEKVSHMAKFDNGI